MSFEFIFKPLVTSIVFSAVGILVFVGGFALLKAITPFDINKELETDQNTALGIVIGSFLLGLAIIIAAAIHGP